MSPGKIRRMIWLGRQARREMGQLRVLWGVAAVVIVMIAGASLLRELNFGTAERRFLWDYLEATLTLWGTVLALALPVLLVQGEAACGALVLTVVRGVRRGEWLLARWLTIAGALAVLAGIGCALSTWLLWRHGHGVEVATVVEAAVRLTLRLWLTAAFSLLAAVLTRSQLLAGGVALGLALAAQLADILAWAGQQGGGAGALWWVVVRGVPSYSVLETGTPLGWALLYAGGYLLAYVALATGMYSNRES